MKGGCFVNDISAFIFADKVYKKLFNTHIQLNVKTQYHAIAIEVHTHTHTHTGNGDGDRQKDYRLFETFWM